MMVVVPRGFVFCGTLRQGRNGGICKMSVRKNEVDLTQGPMLKRILLFALPLGASAVLQQLFNAADLAVVGHFSTPQAMAAVGSNASVISLFVGLFTGLSVGSNVVVATLLGSGKRNRISDAVHTSISVALLSGLILVLAGFFLAKPLLLLMSAPEDVVDLAVLYLRIYFCGMPAMMLYNFGAAVLRSMGDSRRPFPALTAAGVLNILLNLLFVVVFHLHVIGVALGTVLSNCFSGGAMVYFLKKEEGEFHLELRKLRIDREMLLRIVRIGVPAGLQGVVFSISNVVIQSAVNSFGSDCVAGMTASQNFDFICYCMVNAFGQTCVTFISQNYGARKMDRCRKAWGICFLLGALCDFVFAMIVVGFRDQLILIFTSEPAVIEFAMIRLLTALPLHFLTAFYEISGGALRGLNRSMIPAVISILGTCAVRLVYVWTVFPRFGTPRALILVYPLTWIITGVAMNVAYFVVRRKAEKE